MSGVREPVRRWIAGVLLALAVANAVFLVALLGRPTGAQALDGAAYVVVAATVSVLYGLLVLLRDRAPRVTLVAAAVLVCVYYTLGLPSIGVVLPLLLFLASVTLAGHRWFAIVTAALLFAAATYFRLREGEEAGTLFGYELVSNAALAGLAIVLAEVVAARRQLQRSQHEVARLAAEQARSEAERERSAEKARLSRELHDELGHSLAVISLHANAAVEAVPPGSPAFASIGHIRDAVADTLRQLRAAVRALGEGRTRSDRPTVADLPELLDRIQGAGVPVRLEREHLVLDPETGEIAYRIVQEGVTNAVRHADPTEIVVRIGSAGSPASLIVEVDNDGAPALSTEAVGAGTGIAGLRERVVALGGTLRWESGADRFRLRAELPIPPGGET